MQLVTVTLKVPLKNPSLGHTSASKFTSGVFAYLFCAVEQKLVLTTDLIAGIQSKPKQKIVPY